MDEGLNRKLRILADAAKDDASCASSGAGQRKARLGGIGSTTGNGICHAYTPDGRCVSLLKILLTNYCLYDCAYCINRRSSNVERARFKVDEVVRLTMAFYRRNYIEGLFLSSGIVKSADDTMEQLILVAKTLRRDEGFAGYIHLKTLPEASPWLIEEAGLWADRLSINVELPSRDSLQAYAPEKDAGSIARAMAQMGERIAEAREEASPHAPTFAPAGHSTQIIVGADATSDADMLAASAALYESYGLSRVYYSAFSPIPSASSKLPLAPPPLQRESRLYQADWLYRYYGFNVDEIASGGENGMLDLAIDPKLAWALKNRGRFPVDVNTADRDMLLRVPGLGVRAVDRIIAARRHASLRLEDVGRVCAGLKRVRAFIVGADWRPRVEADSADLRTRLKVEPKQMDLF